MNSQSPSPSINPGRREFLKNLLPAGAFACLGCCNLFGQPQQENKPDSAPGKSKFLNDSGMNFQEVFAFAFQYYYIPTMQQMAADMGKELFLETLKKAASAATAKGIGEMAKNFPDRNLAMMAFFTKTNALFQNALEFEVVEETEKAFEIKVHKCLWAETFRASGATDIGYAAICYPDYAMATAFNPKIRMIRPKTLMQGHDCCNHRYVMEE